MNLSKSDILLNNNAICLWYNHSMKLYNKIRAIILLLIVYFFSGFFVANVSAAIDYSSNVDEKGCYSISYTVGNQTAKTNAVCFNDTIDDQTLKNVVYLSQSDGASSPIVLSDGRKLYMEIVGRNPQYMKTNEETAEYEVKGGDDIKPNGNKSASPSGDTPIVEVWARFDGEAWEPVGSIDLESNFNDPDSRKSSFDSFTELIKNGTFTSNYKDLEPAGVEIDDAKTEESAPGDRSDEEQPEDYGGDKSICYSHSGALGWIICPVINGISGVGEWLWEEVETNFLQIPVGQFFKDNNGVEAAWRIFRDIANILFIILFMVVIFSQLTGVGIDNYGIKKILPKLIVAAILINLSYVICILAVDLSNILGTGLNALFSSLANNIKVETVSVSGGQGLALAGLGTGGAVLFGLIAGPLGLVSAGLWVLGTVITIVFSMLFLYLILVIRSAGIVILIAIAPVAIVCYMLPNTEKMFKRWFDLLKALLFVYPICGAMVGAGKLAGNLLASTGTEAMAVAGMVVEVLPFFLIPMLLKQALSLVGNIGAKLSATGRSLGQRSSTATRGAITNSNRFKTWSNDQQGRWNAMKAGRVQRKLEGKIARGENLTASQRARLRNAQDTVLAQEKINKENEIRANGGYYDAMAFKQQQGVEAEANAIQHLNNPDAQKAARQEMANEARRKREAARVALMMKDYRSDTQEQLTERWNQAFESGNQEELSALTTVMHRRFGAAGMNSIASKLSEKTNIKDNEAYKSSMEALQQTVNEDGNLAGDIKSKAPDAFQMISNGGIAKGEDGTVGYQDMSWFTDNNKVATKSKDWATSSAAALKRGLASEKKVIDDHMLDELLTSNDPAIEAFRSDASNRELLQAAKYARDNGKEFTDIANDDVKVKEYSNNYEKALATQKKEQENASQVRIENAIRNVISDTGISVGGAGATGDASGTSFTGSTDGSDKGMSPDSK